MPSPFPGMDPYLERYWRDVHHRLCTYSCDALQPQIRPRLKARIEERTLIELEDAPDRSIYPDVKIVEARGGGGTAVLAPPAGAAAGMAEPLVIRFASQRATEGFVTVLDPANGNRVVTVIEFLSASNKSAGPNREQYEQKRDELHDAGVNLVEVDLLRAGPWPFTFAAASLPRSHRGPYRACVRRGWAGLEFPWYHMPVQERLPRIPIPLRPGDADAVLDLQDLIDKAYLNGAYDDADFDYAADADPPLTGDVVPWADQLLRAAGRRS